MIMIDKLPTLSPNRNLPKNVKFIVSGWIVFLVIILLIVKKSLEYVLKRPIELHPDEHTLISSRQQADRIINGGGFKIVDYYFGIRDLYTHQVIVAEKIQP